MMQDPPLTAQHSLDLPAAAAPFGGEEDNILWRRAGLLLSLSMVAAIVYKAKDVPLHGLLNVPTHPLFWLCLLVNYLATPVSEWLIYRKLWNIPASGLRPLLKKQVTNEVLLGYLGDAQFYLWARQRTEMTGAPFATVKDVSILSAMAGNAATLALLIVGWPSLSKLALAGEMRTIAASIGVLLASSLLVFFFRRRLFSLPRPALWRITAIHLARIAVGLIVLAMAWHLMLGQTPLADLIMLAMLRMLVSRLPLLPNKDLVFATLAVFLLGSDQALGIATAKIALLMLVAHLAVGLALFVFSRDDWKGRRT